MTWKRNVLVVANVTATSEELLAELNARASREPTRFTLVVPATPFGGGRAAALEQLHEAIERLRDAGLEVNGNVGHGDPIVAVTEAWDPKRYDEIVVSTLPMHFSNGCTPGCRSGSSESPARRSRMSSRTRRSPRCRRPGAARAKDADA